MIHYLQQHPEVSGLAMLSCLVLLAVIVMGRRIELHIKDVHFQLMPNGGKTFRDQVVNRLDRLESYVAEAEARRVSRNQQDN